MSPKPFALRIFLADGTVDGVKIVAKSKWTGRGIVIPRAHLPEELGREELNAPGVYILIGSSGEDGEQAIAIGNGDPVAAQLEQEDANSNFWTWTIVSTNKKHRLSQATIQYLTVRLQQTAQAIDKVHLINPVSSALPTLTAEEQETAETYLQHLLCICPILGLTAFEPTNK